MNADIPRPSPSCDEPALVALRQAVPAEHVPAVIGWAVGQLLLVCAERDAHQAEMYRLGSPGVVISAHRGATDDLRELARRLDPGRTSETRDPWDDC